MMMRLKSALTAVAFFFAVTCHAGGPDSLLALLKTVRDDTGRVVLLQNISYTLRKENPAQAKSYAEQALEIASQHGWKMEVASAWSKIGMSLSNMGNFQAAAEAQQEAIKKYGEIGDSLRMSRCIQALGFVYRQQGNYAEALNCHLETARLFQKFNAKPAELARSYANIGSVFFSIRDYDNTIAYYKKCLDIQMTQGSPEDRANSFCNIGAVYLEKKDLHSSEIYLRRALALFDSLQLNYGIATAHLNLGELFIKKNDTGNARMFTTRGLEIYRQIGDSSHLSQALGQLGKIESQAGNFDAAATAFNDALELAFKTGQREQQADLYDQMALLFAKTGDFQRAYAARTAHNQLQDSLLNENKTRQTRELEARYQLSEKNREIADYQQNILQKIRERRLLIGGICCLLLGCGVVLYLWWSRRKAQLRLQSEKDTTAALLREKEELLDHLAAYQSQLLQNEKMASLGQLTAGIAHEINNPVNFIATSAQALRLDIDDLDALLELYLKWQQSGNPEDLKAVLELGEKLNLPVLKKELTELMGSIERGTNRTKDIVAGLSTFSRTEAGDSTPTDLHASIDLALMLLNPQMQGICRIEKQFAPEIPFIPAFPGKLNQAFVNILTNAVQAIKLRYPVAEPPQGLIIISTSCKPGIVQIRISDNGPGMTPEVKNRLFEPFFTTKPVGEGTGLGLSITYGIIQDHHGSIQVDSTPGMGTTFMIELPV